MAGCNRGVESKEAVRQAIVDYLGSQKGMNVGAMQVDVVAVSFRENEADATVTFRTKGSEGAPPMTMPYKLQKQGNRWVVTGRAESGASPHGGTGMPQGMPGGHPDVGVAQPPETKK